MSIQDTFQSIAFSGARFTSFTANAILFGLVPICLWVLRPAFAGVAGDEWSEGKRRLSARLEDMLQACLVASATATFVGLMLQAAIFAGAEGEITGDSFELIASTPFGVAYLVRLPLLVALAVLLLGRVRESVLAGTGDEAAGPRPAWWGAWVLISAALLATSSFSGHAAVGTPVVLSIGNDIVHLMSGATWFAGIVVLAALAPVSWRKKDPATRLQLASPMIVRFSSLAVVAITVVTITGVVNSLFDVERLGDLVSESYGIALSAKLVIFIGILAFGGINNFYVRRRLEKGRATAGVTNFFRKTIAMELALGLLIMGATGVLTGLPKTRESAASAPVVDQFR